MTRSGVTAIVYSMFQLGQVGEEGQLCRLYPLTLYKLWRCLPIIDQDQIYSTASEVGCGLVQPVYAGAMQYLHDQKA